MQFHKGDRNCRRGNEALRSFSFYAKAILIQDAPEKYRIGVPSHRRFDDFDHRSTVIV
jgi:hypothetical protein